MPTYFVVLVLITYVGYVFCLLLKKSIGWIRRLCTKFTLGHESSEPTEENTEDYLSHRLFFVYYQRVFLNCTDKTEYNQGYEKSAGTSFGHVTDFSPKQLESGPKRHSTKNTDARFLLMYLTYVGSSITHNSTLSSVFFFSYRAMRQRC